MGERAGEKKKDILGNERERERETEKEEGVCICVCMWRGVNVSTSQAETITSAGCLFLTHWTNLIEAKHLKSSGNVADPPPVQHTQAPTSPHKPSVLHDHAVPLCIAFINPRIIFRLCSIDIKGNKQKKYASVFSTKHVCVPFSWSTAVYIPRQ